MEMEDEIDNSEDTEGDAVIVGVEVMDSVLDEDPVADRVWEELKVVVCETVVLVDSVGDALSDLDGVLEPDMLWVWLGVADIDSVAV